MDDLFDDIPECFNGKAEFEEWLLLRHLSRETVTICHDCTKAYQKKMMAENRCFPTQYAQKFTPIFWAKND